MKTPAIALRIILAAMAVPAAAQSTCGCGDVAELQARYCAARSAKEEYNRMILLTHRREREKVEVLTSSNREEVQQCADLVISMANSAFGAVGQGRDRAVTDDKTCTVNIVSASSSCTREVLAAHEEWHARQCTYNRGVQADEDQMNFIPKWFSDLQDWRVIAGQTLVDYMLEESMGYTLEQQAIANRLQQLSGKCPHKPPPKAQRRYSIAPCPEFKRGDYSPKDKSKECQRQ